jgi:hypothetical protein
MGQATCTHAAPENWVFETFETSCGPVVEQVNRGGDSLFADISLGAFACTRCGKVGYYTGHWRAYYEDGVACPGSAGVDRAPVLAALGRA